MIRLVPDQSRQVVRSEKVEITFDGRPVQAYRGESVAAALLRAGHLRLRNAPVDGAPRGTFCCMGLCQECVVKIEGSVTESCRLAAENGLAVASIDCGPL
ncbi:(2Fe-2S)-binding protein [Roseibium sp. SCP14]|uniref:(2Fe-2S)-binding protein n=1 Tax=Roseibium sp. SCP14 TaxID=3141375 RepID=UPI0033364C8D